MVDYREILRLKSLGYSRNQIEASAHISHHTVKAVLDTAESLGICWPLVEKLTNAVLQETFFPGKNVTPTIYAEPDYAWIHRELAKPGVTLTLLWTEYSEESRVNGLVPYMRTQFCDKYRSWARLTKATMRIQHKPGEAMQVDWAGNTIPVYNSVTGDVSKAYVFVAVLPCSCFAYAEACEDMKTENWLLCHVHAFEYFGGVTRLLIPDNCKTGVTTNTRYETVLNRSYLELTEHYGTAVVPARVLHPNAEWTKRQNNKVIRFIREAHFSILGAAMEEIEYLPDRQLDRAELLRYSTCKFVDDGRHIILKGATGSGKTYIACALGICACRRFKHVRYIRLPELLDELSLAKAAGEFKKAIKQYKKADLLILDEWLLRSLSMDGYLAVPGEVV